ncbi:behavioral response to nicotine [Mactra antiquata]
MFLHRCFCIFVLLSIVTVVTSYDTSTADSLHTALTLGYNEYVRPSGTTTVTVKLGLLSVNVLDVKTQEFTVTGWLDVSWTDSRFSWTPASYSNIEDMYLDTAYCWNPKVAVDNAAHGLSEAESNKLFKIQYTGTVTWSISGQMTVHCSTDVKFYPYDEQECFISVKSLAYPAAYVPLASGGIDKSQYSENDEWDLTSTAVSVTDVDVSGVNYSCLKFKMTLSRRHWTILVTVIVPMLLVSFAGMLVFLIPAENSSKIGYTVAILIAELLLMIVILDVVPLASSHVPILGNFFLTLIILNFLEIFATITIVKLYNNKFRSRPVKQMHERLAAVCFALTCFRPIASASSSPRGSPTNETETTSIESPQVEGTPPEFKHALKRKLSIKAISPDNSFATSSKEEFRRERRRSRAWVGNGVICGCSNGVDRKWTWDLVSSAIDRMCFLLFLLIRLIVTIIFMIIMSGGSS